MSHKYDDSCEDGDIFFNSLESHEFFALMCKEDFDALDFFDIENGSKEFETMLEFCIINACKKPQEVLHSCSDLLGEKKVQDEVSKLKIQREMLETLRRGLSDAFFCYAPFDTCVGLLFDMILRNIREYRAITNRTKSLLRFKNCSSGFVDSPLTTIFDVEFLNTTDGIVAFSNMPNNSVDDIYAQKSRDTSHSQSAHSGKEEKLGGCLMPMTNDILANVFEIFSIVLNCDDSFRTSGLSHETCRAREKIINKHIDAVFLLSIINQMATSASNDCLDRELCRLALVGIANRGLVQKNLISALVNFINECIYCHSNIENFTLRGGSNAVYLEECSNCNYVTTGGIRDILSILNVVVVKTFQNPLRRYQRELLRRTLLPLHTTIFLPVIIDLVTNCALNILNLDPSLLLSYLRILLNKIWPQRSSVKQACLLHEIKAMILFAHKHNNVDALELIFSKLSCLIGSKNFQISLEYISLFEIVEFIQIFQIHKKVLVPIVEEAFEQTSRLHWHRGVRLRCQELLEAIDVMWEGSKNRIQRNLRIGSSNQNGETSKSNIEVQEKVLKAFSPKRNQKANDIRLFSPARQRSKGFFNVFSKLPVLPSESKSENKGDVYKIFSGLNAEFEDCKGGYTRQKRK